MSSPWHAGAPVKAAMTRNQRKPKQKERRNNMKTKIIGKMLLSLGLAFVFGSAITELCGDILPLPVPLGVTIHSAGDVTRGQTGSFVVRINPPPWGRYVKFSVSGTAIPGIDYVPLVSPAFIVGGYGVISVATLPDPRGSFFPQAYSVDVTIEPGLGYTVGEPSSAQLIINP